MARLALATDAPVDPGRPAGGRSTPLDVDAQAGSARCRGTRSGASAGPPVDLSAYRARPLTAELLREVTDVIMGAVRDQLAEVRGETPPAEFFRRPPARGGVLMRAAVLGAGSWGTTFAKVLADAGGDVTLWARRPELVAAVGRAAREPATTCPASRCRRRCGPPPTPAEALDGAEIVVLARAGPALRENLAGWAAGDRRRTPRWSA